MNEDDYPYLLSDLVKKQNFDFDKLNTNVFEFQIIEEMKHISHSKSVEDATPEGFSTLEELYDKYWRQLPDETKDLVRNGNPELKKVYLLGQIYLAQRYAAGIIYRLPRQRAYELLDDENNIQIFELLKDRNQYSIKALSEKLNRNPSELKNTFQELISFGLCDFRSNGTEQCFFMTNFAENYHKNRKS